MIGARRGCGIRGRHHDWVIGPKEKVQGVVGHVPAEIKDNVIGVNTLYGLYQPQFFYESDICSSQFRVATADQQRAILAFKHYPFQSLHPFFKKIVDILF